jgi:hypothetical protein
MTPAEHENGSLLWCAGCRLAFFAVGTRAEVRARARACGWVADGGRHWCDLCAPRPLDRGPAGAGAGPWDRWEA